MHCLPHPGLVWAKVVLTDSPNGSYANTVNFNVAVWCLQQAPEMARLQLIVEPDGGLGPEGFRPWGG